MTKIIEKLPVSAEALQDFRKDELKKYISRTDAILEGNFSVLCLEFTNRFNANEWIYMDNKDVYYNNDIFGLIPNLDKRACDACDSYYSYNESFLNRLEFSGFKGDLPTYYEAKISFVDKAKYFRNGGYIRVRGSGNSGLTYRDNDGRYAYYSTYNGGAHYHNDNYRWGNMWTIPFFRFGAKDTKGNAPRAILKWLEFDLMPQNFKTEETKKFFNELKFLYAKYKDYLHAKNGAITFKQEKIFEEVLAGKEFDFLPDAKKILAANTVPSSNEFVNALRGELLNGDKIRADIDPYDANILIDPNRGHWDLWDYGAGEEKAGEIVLEEKLTARDPADDINNGIVAIDFGTKSTVVVYENDRLQIIPLQVGSGNYSKGVKAKNYENPTVIQFINLKNFVEAYKARAGRPKTKWNDVTVSHNAFENLGNSKSEFYYSFLTGLKHWCGSNNRMKIQDNNKVTADLSPFMELREDEIDPLEYYAYYLGLYINNMLQEKRIFLKYIMSFPVTYENGIREKMRRSFQRGLKKSFPTALLSNEAAMKKFTVQTGASEPAAYAITALQEYNFDPEDDQEYYYAVFDFGGGTTDFDFGVFRESELDRYDYSLIHFGESGDRTLGGENLLQLLAFEVFKANQETLLNPNKDDKSVGKIPFTFAADKKDFVGSAALIKDSQEAHLNMHNLAEKLRPIWEDPDGEDAKKILAGDKGIEVDLSTDKGEPLPKFVLHTAFKDFKLDLKKILRDRISQGIENFFIAMSEAFFEGAGYKDYNIKVLNEIDEVSIFLAGNSSKSKLVKEIFAEYLGQIQSVEKTTEIFEDTVAGGESVKYTVKNVPAEIIPVESKAAKLLDIDNEEMPQFKIYPALGTAEALEIQKARGVEVNPNDIAAPTGKTGVAFGLLKCRDSGNVKITHITPTAEYTPFQFYVGRNKKRKFKTVINKNTKFGEWYKFIDAGNDFDILYSDLPEAVSNQMEVEKAHRINITLDKIDPSASVFIRAVKSNVIEYAVAKNVEDLADAAKVGEPIPVTLS